MTDLKSQLYRDINIGLADGGILCFAVIAGLYGAHQLQETILAAGVITAVSGASVFAVSRYSTEKTAGQHFDPRKTAENAQQETRRILHNLGFTEKMQESTIAEMLRDEEQWAGNIITGEKDGSHRRPLLVALAIGLSFLIGGLVVLTPFLILPALSTGFIVSAAAFLALMAVCGVWKSSFLHRNAAAGAFIQLLVGSIAGLLTFFVGRILIS